MAIPGLPSGNRSRVLRQMVNLMQTDSWLSTFFPAGSAWSISDGKPFNAETASARPHVYLAPRPYTMSWYGSDSMSGILQVDVYFWLSGNNAGLYNAYDALDVWEVIERVFYPLDDTPERTKQIAIRKSLKDCGAKTGLVTFSQPATMTQTADTGLVSYGSLQIDVARRVAP